MEIVLTLLSLLLAFIALPWLKEPTERLIRQLQTRIFVRRLRGTPIPTLAAVRAVQSGSYGAINDTFMICDWDHQIKVDRHGFTDTRIVSTIVNISNKGQLEFTFPLYFLDPPRVLKAWVRIGKNVYRLDPQYDSKNGAGMVHIPFPSSLRPRDDIRFEYWHEPIWTYEEGSNWWEWYMARPHSIFRLKLEFAEEWNVYGVQAHIDRGQNQPKPPRLSGNVLYWQVKAPILGCKYQLEFSLVHKNPDEKLEALRETRGLLDEKNTRRNASHPR